MTNFKPGQKAIFTVTGDIVEIEEVFAKTARVRTVVDGMVSDSYYLALSTLQPLALEDETDAASPVRQFSSGATRSSDVGKLDYEGFLSPLALEAFAKYMNLHRVQPDGSVRASDNWQKGIPLSSYQASLIRHVFAAWKSWRDMPTPDEPIVLSLCAIIFNAQGMLHELLLRSPTAAEDAISAISTQQKE